MGVSGIASRYPAAFTVESPDEPRTRDVGSSNHRVKGVEAEGELVEVGALAEDEVVKPEEATNLTPLCRRPAMPSLMSRMREEQSFQG